MKQLKALFIATCILETGCATWFLKIPHAAALVSIIYFLAGCTIAIILLFLPPLKMAGGLSLRRRYPVEFLFKSLSIIALAIFLFVESKGIFAENPIDYRNADMLPVIKTMNERFLSGHWKEVYDNIPGIWSGSKPIYLPFMWLPFSPAVALHADLRWVTVAALFIIFIVLINVGKLKRNNPFSWFTLVTSFSLLYWLISQDDDHGFISLTEEGVIVLIYVLLTISLISEKILLICISLGLCMLSRYAAIGFVPAFIIYLLLNRKIRQVFILLGGGAVFFLLFLIIPFGWKLFVQLLQVPESYIGFSKIVWKDSPEVFAAGLGFARFFIPGKMNALHDLLIGLTFLVPAAFVIWCYALRKKNRLNNLPLAAMKISLVVFYSFIDVPYLYLFYTSVFVSLVMAAYLFSNDLNLSEAQ